MKSIFGISLADEGMFLTHLLQNQDQKDLLYTGHFDYPFEYRDDLMFDEKNLLKLSDIIVKQKETRQIEELSICFVLPFKFAYLKNIALPKKSNTLIEKSQIEWEMSNYVTGDLSDYKVINTEHMFTYGNYTEIIILAVKKSLIKALLQLSSSCNADLGSIIMNNFALENFLNYYDLCNKEEQQIVFRIGKNSIETHLYFNGKYYSSMNENLNLVSEETDPTQKIIGCIKENYKYFTNLCEQLPDIQKKPIKTMIYGTSVTDELIMKIKRNFSNEFVELNIKNYPEYLTNSQNFIEAFGAIL
jgi:hypothetical protein